MPAVIFDVDGVLSDTNGFHVAARQHVLTSVGVRYEPSPAYSGMKDDVFFGLVLSRAGKKAVLHDLISQKNDFLVQHIRWSALAMPEAVACVTRLRKQFQLAVASSSELPVVRAILEKIGVADAFPIVVTSEDVAEGKPSPDPYLKAAEKLGLAPNECVAIEDSRNGLLSAKRAGMKLIAVPDPGFPQNLNGADAHVTNLSEVTRELILKLASGM